MQKQDEALIIEKYLLGQLSDQEATEFEAYYLSNPECLDELEAASKLHQGMKALAEKPAMELSSSPTPFEAANDTSWWNAKAPLWAVAAMLLLALLPSVLLTLKDSVEAPGDVSVTAVSLGGLRSAQAEKIQLDANRGRQILGFYIDPEIPEFVYPLYSLSVSDEKGRQVLTLSGLKRDERLSMLYVDLGTDLLKEGMFHYALEGINNDHSEHMLKKGIIQVN